MMLTAHGAQSERIECDVQGIHCAACVSVIETVFERTPGALSIEVNPTLGQATLSVDGTRFRLAELQRELTLLGYRIAARGAPRTSDLSGLLWRMGVCAALAANSMGFSFAVYFGLSEGPLFMAMGFINLFLATAVLLIGGSYFLKNAWAAIRARVWHVDIPLGLSVVLAYGGATYVFFSTGFGATYFDTFAGYVALMLLGKYLPARLIERNRATLLDDDGLSALPQSRIIDGRIERCSAGEVARGDTLLILAGDLVTTDAMLLEEEALLSLDWLTGEALPKRFVRGDVIPAGAFNVGSSPFSAKATSSHAESPLHAVMGTGVRDAEIHQSDERSLGRFARIFVIGVLAVAAMTFIAWAAFDWQRGLWASVCVLIVACPCAVGLGSPLALEMTLRRLRQAGVFVRRQETLAKLAEVDSIAFDKTGTLTELVAETRDIEDRDVLIAMCAQSNHPAARAVRASFDGAVRATDERAEEEPGVGLAMGRYRLVRSPGLGHALDFTRDGQLLGRIDVKEKLREDARTELKLLQAQGYDLAILSGDQQARVDAVARELPVRVAMGDMRPQDKAQWIAARKWRHVLALGDGVNDLPAFVAAFCSGTPAVDRPFVPARADFYYRARGMAPIRTALQASRRYILATRGNYAFAAVYNAAVLAVAAAGHMTPLIAALLMPTSSIAIVALNALIVSRKGTTWKSS